MRLIRQRVRSEKEKLTWLHNVLSMNTREDTVFHKYARHNSTIFYFFQIAALLFYIILQHHFAVFTKQISEGKVVRHIPQAASGDEYILTRFGVLDWKAIRRRRGQRARDAASICLGTIWRTWGTNWWRMMKGRWKISIRSLLIIRLTYLQFTEVLKILKCSCMVVWLIP